jgi:hypothetical protein
MTNANTVAVIMSVAILGAGIVMLVIAFKDRHDFGGLASFNKLMLNSIGVYLVIVAVILGLFPYLKSSNRFGTITASLGKCAFLKHFLFIVSPGFIIVSLIVCYAVIIYIILKEK